MIFNRYLGSPQMLINTRNKAWMLLFFLTISGLPLFAFNDDFPKEKKASKVIAFPGAEGYGQYTTGGRGGKVLIVSNLNDSGPGSLRDAIEKDFPRIIVFDVSGIIPLESELKINDGNVTIAGQSAPGDGICLKNFPMVISADNVIVRYMRFRMGDEKGYEGDAFSGLRRKNIMIDHCSVSWGTDEVATFYDNENFTMQWCIIAESLNASVHKKGDHGYGGIWGGMGASFHHNLLTHHKSRLPRFCGSRYHKEPEKEIVDFRNNVIYNWMINNSYGGEKGNHNLINNYYKPGPATNEKTSGRIVNPSEPYGKFYVDGNFVDGNEKVSENNWNGGVQCDDPQAVRSTDPFPAADIKTHSPQRAYQLVLAYAGASLKRDALDKRVIKEVESGTTTYKGSLRGKSGIIDTQTDVGGWPELKSATPLKDTDKDGMPDVWEKSHKLNPNDPADANGRSLDEDYDNIEVYLNGLVAKIAAGQTGK